MRREQAVEENDRQAYQQDGEKQDGQAGGAAVIGPAVGDVGGRIGADGIKSPLAEGELAIETVNQVEAQG